MTDAQSVSISSSWLGPARAPNRIQSIREANYSAYLRVQVFGDTSVPRSAFPRSIPPGVDVFRNAEEAAEMPLDVFLGAVRSGGKWDYKTQGEQYEAFGNWHYGWVAAARGWPELVSRMGAGAYQILSGTWRPSFGWFLEPPFFGDDPRDQAQISGGYAAHERFYESAREPLHDGPPEFGGRQGIRIETPRSDNLLP